MEQVTKKGISTQIYISCSHK